MLTADDLAQISQHLLRPLSVRIANLAARATVQLVDDSGKLQTLQIGDIAGGPYDDAEHVQSFGFSSVPLAGADTAVVIFPGGDRAHPLVVAVGDRRHRPTGGDPGTVTVYNHTGASITITKDGDIRARAAPGRDLIIDDGSGSTEPVVKRSEFLSHGHPTAGTGPVSPPITAPGPPGSAVTFPGTETLHVK